MALALLTTALLLGAAALVWVTVYGVDLLALLLGGGTAVALAVGLRRLRPFLGTPRGRAAVRTGVTALLVAMGAGLGGALLHRHVPWRWDWTRTKKFTLSAATAARLRLLARPVTLTLVRSPAAMPFGGTELNEELEDLVAQYRRAARGRLRVRVWDFVADHPRLLGYVRRLGINPEDLYFPLLIARCGRAVRVLNAWDFVETVRGEARFRGEEELTRALEEVTQPERPKVYFTRGHEEGDTTLQELPGFSQVRAALEGENLEVATVSLERTGAVPRDAAALVILGPRRDFTAREVAALEAYRRRGGRFLVCLDSPLEVAEEPRRLRAWLRRLGLAAPPGVILDPEANFREMPDHLWIDAYGEHPMVAVLEGSPCVFPAARALRDAPEGEGAMRPWVLATSSKASWLETDLPALEDTGRAQRDADEPAGPLAVAVALEGGEARLVVVGDVTFLQNATLRRLPAVVTPTHRRFLRHALNWLLAREGRLRLPPRRYGHPLLTAVELSERRLRLLQWLSLLAGPALVGLLGLAVWGRRRR